MREYAESLTYATAQTPSIGGVCNSYCLGGFWVPIEYMEALEALGGEPMARDPDRRVSIAPQPTRSFSDSTLGAADELPPPVTVLPAVIAWDDRTGPVVESCVEINQ